MGTPLKNYEINLTAFREGKNLPHLPNSKILQNTQMYINFKKALIHFMFLNIQFFY